MDDTFFDGQGRFILRDFGRARPFSSFLPGIAGPLGIPMWVFYVNRGQAIASFGIENKDNPIMEFEPANKAYQGTPYAGFRTFLKVKRGVEEVLYEPFAPANVGEDTRMCIGMNELELHATSRIHGIQSQVLYFTLSGEPFAGLVRQVTVTNVGSEALALELLDGMARVMPFGVDNWGLKEIGRTLEAFMAVLNLDDGLPFYRFQASAGDSAEISQVQAGHFYLSFDSSGQKLLPFVDPVVVFGQNTSLCTPDGFVAQPLDDLGRRRQITTGRTPCGLFGASQVLEPGEAATLYAIIGHAGHAERILREKPRLAQPAYVQQKRQEARQLVDQLTDAVATHTSSPRLDAYTRQTFLDNVLRGGWPLLLGGEKEPPVYYIYSRKHGDLERDYNYFYLAAEPYSHGNANYRDVNQNRRCDVLLRPEVGTFNVLSFLSLIQADGYNPLVVEGSRFTLPASLHAAVLALAERPEELEPVLAQPFTPGQLLRTITDREIGLKGSPKALVAEALSHAEHHFQAAVGEGYWIDHWTYNLDLIETYLAVYPERKEELLFGGRGVSFFDSPVIVQPRALKYVLAGEGRVRQYGAVVEDEEKGALIASRTESPNLVRTAHGQGEVYRTTVLGKLVGLALLKFATLDPLGMGVEMEAGKPSWCDALNGLPGLFGSSLCETYELERLLTFLLEAMAEKNLDAVGMPAEQHTLLLEILGALVSWLASDGPDRDFRYWDAVASARETYRASVRLGFDGETRMLPFEDLAPTLAAFRAKVRAGIQRAVEMNQGASPGIPPTYFIYTVTDYDLITDANGEPRCDEQGRPFVRARGFEPAVLPLYLEGPVHALKLQPDLASARELYAKIKASDLYDRKLGMYQVNAPLEDQIPEIGRARAFTPGWLENESIWLHMEYKYLLEVLQAGLYEEFFEEFEHALVCFQDPQVYGRSPLENSSFLVSSAHPDELLHGAGFVARLSGATAEFLSIWTTMMAGGQPFFLQNEALCLQFRPALPGWLFDQDGKLTFTFLGQVPVTYHNPDRRDIYPNNGLVTGPLVLHLPDGRHVEFAEGMIGEPYARMVRARQITKIDIFFHTE
ncbi:MAG: cellobiose phosphorylase [Anaerolineae bacterium]|nr:cellobiose phosphorylase [Anaerolineae bacterium]